MKKLLAVLLFAACSNEEQMKSDAQDTLDDVVKAFVTNDKALFLSRLKLNADEPSGFADHLWEYQRDGLRTHFNDQSPELLDVRDEGGGNISAAVFANAEQFNRMSPKRLHFWRDPTDGKVYWTGITSHDSDRLPRLRQSVTIASATYDEWNQSSGGRFILTTCYTNGIFGAQACSEVNNNTSCYYVDWNQPVPLGQLNAGWSGNITVTYSNHYGGDKVVLRESVANTACTCTTGMMPNTENKTDTYPNACCGINVWGWDMWHPSSSVASDNPTCGASGSCPP